MHSSHRRQNLRAGRHSEPGRVYMITIVVDSREPLFTDWQTGRPVVQALKHAETDGMARTLCWVLMPDHIHWLLELQADDLSFVVARFKSRSTVWVNRVQGRHGPLWQKGFHDHALRKEEDIKLHARYIVANPIRAGLVPSVRMYSLWDAIWLEP